MTHGIPELGQLCYGQEDATSIGMTWIREELQPSIIFQSLSNPPNPGWTVRVLASVSKAINSDAKNWSDVETGGALFGHVSRATRTIIVAGLIDAPSDSVLVRPSF